MPDRLIRTQILLEPEQHQLLIAFAEQEKRSLSDLVREMLQTQLIARQQSAKLLLERRLQALEQIKLHRQQILQRRKGQVLPIDPAQLINQLREERDEQIYGGHE